MLPPRPANAVFRLRIGGRLSTVATNKAIEAEWFAMQHAAPGRIVEIIDGVTGRTLKRYPECDPSSDEA